MSAQRQKESSLQQRVHQVLQNKHSQYAAEASNEETIEALAGLLQKAEVDLASAEERVRQLKRHLEKAQSKGV